MIYLQNERIEKIKFDISDKNFCVACDHTLFLRMHKIDLIPEKEIKALLKGAKNLKGKAAAKRNLKLYADYKAGIEKHHALFDRIAAFLPKLEKRGIRAGYIYDRTLKALQCLEHENARLFYRSALLSQYMDFVQSLRNAQNGEYSAVYIHDVKPL